MKHAFSEIDGLNLFLTTKKARLQPRPSSHFPPENIWLALRAAKEKAAHADGNSEKSLLLAEREGFEPSVHVNAHLFSRQASSTTPAPLRTIPMRRDSLQIKKAADALFFDLVFLLYTIHSLLTTPLNRGDCA